MDCQEPFNLQEVARSASGFIQRIDETAKKLDASVSDLQRVVLNEQTLTNFSIAINNMRAFSEQAHGHDRRHQRAHRDERLAGRPRLQQHRRLFARS